MAYSDLREYLKALKERGKLHEVEAEVDKDWEISAVCRRVFQRVPEKDRPALKFNRVRGFTAPVVAGVLGASREVYALALGTEPGRIMEKWFRGLESPVHPIAVNKGSCQENVFTGEGVDLSLFPVPTWTVEHDPGPYITSPYVFTKNPETGVRNVGTYRVQVKGKKRLGLFAGRHHGMLDIQKWEARGEPAPVAIVIGADPVIGLVSVSSFPYGMDEMSVAGGLRGSPVELIRCLTVPLEVPATAEIVLEGEMVAGVREKEGPFGEYTGYMGAWGNHPVIDVKAVTYRNDFIYQAFFSQMPPSESSCIRSIGRELPLLKHLKYDLGLPVQDLCFTESGGSGAILIISIRKQYAGQVQQIASAAWGASPSFGKYTIVVDDDIDIRDSFSVQWAMSFRVQPHRDIHIVSHTTALGLDPSQASVKVPQHDPSRRTSSKVIIDSTKKHEYPPLALPPEDHLDRVKQHWKEYGF
jgi:4-hydroxy-3-polyprenylbenzoate decarboxylase